MTFTLPLRVAERKGAYKSKVFVLMDRDDKWICTTTTEERAFNLRTLAAQTNEMHFILCDEESERYV